ncbi:MAG: hypothetical protein J2P50_05010 [Hyphomicrobiaceae bacterium]|nr:hypothetical protein [Hyphomicrobiaceae bacterium]
MTKDDKLLRETVLAELRRRRCVAGDGQDRARREPADAGHAARPEADSRMQVALRR